MNKLPTILSTMRLWSRQRMNITL